MVQGFLLVSSAGNSQLVPAVEWYRCLTDIDDQSQANAITFASDGGSVVAGGTGSGDLWLAKLTDTGELDWQTTWGGTDWEAARSVVGTLDGGYIVAGSTTSFDGDVTFNHGQEDWWLVKFDAYGNLIWQRSLGGSSSDYGHCVISTSDGGYAVAGTANSNDGDVVENNGSVDAWFVKLSNGGEIEWSANFGGSLGDFAESIIQTSDGGFAVVGETRSSDGDIDVSYGLDDVWLIKLNTLGLLEWKVSIGGSNNDEVSSVIQMNNDGFLVSGHTYSNDGLIDDNNGASDLWLVGIGPSGEFIWQRTYGGPGHDRAKSLMVTTEGDYFVFGETGSYSGDVPNSIGSMDYWLMNFSDSGDILWQSRFGGSGNDYAAEACVNDNDEIILLGNSGSLDGQVECNIPTAHSFLVKLSTSYNILSGQVFLDMNGNGFKDAVEMVMPQHRVGWIDGTGLAWTDTQGNFEVQAFDPGTFVLETEQLLHFEALPSTHTVVFTGLNEIDSLNDFAFQPVGVVNDLSISIAPLTAFRPGFAGRYLIHYKNIGNTVMAPIVGFQFVHPFTYLSASLVPTAITPDSVSWQLPELQPFEEGTIEVTVNISTTAVLGSTIIAAATIFPLEGDANIADNKALWWVTITGSYDPNDIKVDRSAISPEELEDGVDLTYLIRFQNTGTDTAFTVRVDNPFPVNADFNTFDFIAASHPVQISYSAATSKLSFQFDNILLPDSNTNEPESHGYILYRIKPRSTLVLGDSVLNQVGIYFDYNLPIITNVAHTVIEQPTGIPSAAAGSALTLFPNPTTGEVMLRVPRPVSNGSVTVTDAIGRTVLHTTMTGSAYRLDLRPLPSGVYLIAVQDDEGGFQQRVVVE